MPTPSTFDWAVIRVVPRVERGEQVNVGAILYCRSQGFLEARIALDPARLLALAPGLDLEAVDAALALIPLVAAGDARGGPIAALPQAERFHWLTSPRSTVTQTSAIHTGLCEAPAASLDAIITRMVLPLAVGAGGT